MRRGVLVGMTLTLLLLATIPARADLLFESYYVTVKDFSGYFSGIAGDTYVFNPAVSTRKIVSFAVSRGDASDWIEVGWQKWGTNPLKHVVWYTFQTHKYYHDGGEATAGTWYTYTTRYWADSYNSFLWRSYVDGAPIYADGDPMDFNTGTLKSGAERGDGGSGGTNNSAYVVYLRHRISGLWYAWTDLRKQFDTDPYYGHQDISNTAYNVIPD